jgi:formylglycine-generating enzyme required for sulfatase activity
MSKHNISFDIRDSLFDILFSTPMRSRETRVRTAQQPRTESPSRQKDHGVFSADGATTRGGRTGMNKSVSVIAAGLGLWLLAGLGCGDGKSFINSIGMEFVRVPAGSFTMGTKEVQADPFSNRPPAGNSNEKPAHQVTISQDFYMGKYEVTQAQWYAVMGNNPSNFKSEDVGGDSRNHPVEQVSWDDAQEFITKLNAKEGKNYRLPTEAEWEYACRSGGKDEKYCGGNDPAALAWYMDNSGKRTHQVGTKQPNGLGLYDMSGNVEEWCWDWHDADYYTKSPAADPRGPSGGKYRESRGGYWSYLADHARAASRGSDSPYHGYSFLGFRLVAPQVQEASWEITQPQ